MKPEKQFDCVKMKVEIQQRLLREIAEFGEEEAARIQKVRLADDPILSAFLARLTLIRGSRRTPAA